MKNLVEKITKDIAMKKADEIDRAFFSRINLIEPRISGKITKGKLRWRGVKIVIIGKKTFLFQREKNLGELFDDDLIEIKVLDLTPPRPRGQEI